MTLENLKQAMLKNNLILLERLAFENQDILKNFSVDGDGNVLYNGEKIISDIKISKEKDNAIIQKEDGIYVNDREDDIDDLIKKYGVLEKSVTDSQKTDTDFDKRCTDIEKTCSDLQKEDAELKKKDAELDKTDQALRQDINKISQFKSYVNAELEYGTYSLGNEGNYISLSKGILPLKKYNGNMEESDNGLIPLKAGKKYSVTYGIYTINSKNTGCRLYMDGKPIIHAYSLTGSNGNTASSDNTKSVILEPETNCNIWVINEYDNIAFDVGSNKTFLAIHEIGHDMIIDPMEYVNGQQGIEDTPVGHILSYMGNNPPKHYLSCDGQVYNISDYPYLANHILDQFGSYGFWGGDGLTTFAVPDLRGEFLRGSGTASRDTGEGADVGLHQNPTIQNEIVDASNIDGMNNITLSQDNAVYENNKYNQAFQNIDKKISTSSGTRAMLKIPINGRWTDTIPKYGYTSRPTNTAVMYCIKYEPTYYFQHTTQENITNEVIKEVRNYVGKGEEDLLEEPVSLPPRFNNNANVSNPINLTALKKPIDEFDEIQVVISNSKRVCDNIRKVSEIKYGFSSFCLLCLPYSSDYYLSATYGFIDNKTIGCFSTGGNNVDPINWSLVHVYGIKYTKPEETVSDNDIQKVIKETIDILKKGE